MKSIKDVSDYLDYGMFNNNIKSNYVEYMEHIRNFLLNEAEINQSHLFPILQQTNQILINLHHCDNKELKNDYFALRKLLIVYLTEKDEEEDETIQYMKTSPISCYGKTYL